MKKTFTLVELIIVITILAILSVSAFLVVSQWIGKSRDSRRLSDLSTIQKALELSLTKSFTYPTPDGAVNIMAGSVILGQQGKFGDSATAATDIKSTPKDPLDNVAYTYYVATGGENYQVMGFLENSSTLTFRGIESQGPRSTVSDQENLQFSNSACTCNSNGTNSICSVASLAFCLNYAHASEVSAADYSVRVPTTKGETLGILILSGTNQPVEELGSTVDLSTSTSNLIAVFSNTDKNSGTGGQILSPISIKNNVIRVSPLLGFIDPSLIGYRNMETLSSTGTLEDFSKIGRDGVFVGNYKFVSGKRGKAIDLGGVGSHVLLDDWNVFAPSKVISISIWVNLDVLDADAGGCLDNLISLNPFALAGDDRINVHMSCNSNIYWQYATNGTSISSMVSMPLTSKLLSNWNHFVFVADTTSGFTKIYQNGVLMASSTATGNHSSAIADLLVGNIDGKVDEMRIYNRVLSDSEIQTLYATQ